MLLPFVGHSATVFIVCVSGWVSSFTGDSVWVVGTAIVSSALKPFPPKYVGVNRKCLSLVNDTLTVNSSLVYRGQPKTKHTCCVACFQDIQQVWVVCVHVCLWPKEGCCVLSGFRGITEGKPLVLTAGHYCSCEYKTQIWSCGICLLYLIQGRKGRPTLEMRASCWRWRQRSTWIAHTLSF